MKDRVDAPQMQQNEDDDDIEAEEIDYIKLAELN